MRRITSESPRRWPLHHRHQYAGVLTEDTADMTMALILAGRGRPRGGRPRQRHKRGSLVRWAPTWMLGRRITGKRLGIVGMGRIGQALARRANAFGLSIHYHIRRQRSR